MLLSRIYTIFPSQRYDWIYDIDFLLILMVLFCFVKYISQASIHIITLDLKGGIICMNIMSLLEKSKLKGSNLKNCKFSVKCIIERLGFSFHLYHIFFMVNIFQFLRRSGRYVLREGMI